MGWGVWGEWWTDMGSGAQKRKGRCSSVNLPPTPIVFFLHHTSGTPCLEGGSPSLPEKRTCGFEFADAEKEAKFPILEAASKFVTNKAINILTQLLVEIYDGMFLNPFFSILFVCLR